MPPRAFLAASALVVALFAGSATAQQQSESYKFLEAVREGKGNDVIAIIERPGSTIINTRAIGTGEGAIHIVVKRGDEVYTRYLLQRGADANLRDGRGNTPLILAVLGGHAGLVPLLIAGKANVNLANGGGETPLILAVQRRDTEVARALLDAGADADQTDNVAGLSARDYARRDARNPALVKLLEDAPKRTRGRAAGPRL